jgi:hypothetical protein
MRTDARIDGDGTLASAPASTGSESVAARGARVKLDKAIDDVLETAARGKRLWPRITETAPQVLST